MQTNFSNPALTREYLVSELRRIGVEKGMTLEVHSSLSSFGYVEGGAQTVIAALKEAVGEDGSIFMPSLRLSGDLPLSDEDKRMGILRKIRILPENRTKTAMGAVADEFRMLPDTLTGGGVMQISGWGKHAREAVSGGLDFALHNGGKGLLLGVDIYKLTAMHYVEMYLPEEIRAIFAPSEEVNEKYPPEEWFIETGCPPVAAWYTIQNMALEKGVIKTDKIGGCGVMFFDLYDVVSIYEEQLKTRPFELYGLK